MRHFLSLLAAEHLGHFLLTVTVLLEVPKVILQ